MDRLRLFLFTVFFFSTWLHFSAAMVNRACHQRSWNGGASTELLQLLPTNMWRIWRRSRQVGKNETPRFEGKKQKIQKPCQKATHEWLWLYDCYIVLQMKQFLYLFLHHFFFCAKKTQLQLEGAKLRVSNKNSRTPRELDPIQVGSFPFLFHLYGISVPFGGSFHGESFWLTVWPSFWIKKRWLIDDGFHFPFFNIPSTNKPTWLTCGSGNLPNFEAKSEEEGSLHVFVKCLLPVYSVLYSKMFKIFAVLQTSQEVLRTPNKNHQNSNALPNTGHNITIKRS